MPRLKEIERIELPSMKSYKPRKRRSFAEKNALLLIFLALCTVAFFKFVVEPIVVPERASAVSPGKTNAEWEKEICANLDNYSNADEFRKYCDWRLHGKI